MMYDDFVDSPVSDMIPESLKAKWDVEIAWKKNIFYLNTYYTFKDALLVINFSTFERSGAFGPNWVLDIPGATISTPFLKNKIFTWHYHPKSDDNFSIWDWFLFVYSTNLLTVLFTNNTISLYKKRENALSLYKKIISASEKENTIYLDLHYLRFERWLLKMMDKKDIGLLQDKDIANLLSVDYVTTKIK